MSLSRLSPLPLTYIECEAIASPLRDLNNPDTQDTPNDNDRMRQLEKMLNEAQGRAEVLERDTYDKAYCAGEQAGMDLGRKRAEQVLDNMQSLLKQSETHARQLMEQSDQVVLEIAETVIRHVIDSMLEEHPEYLKRMVEQAVSFLPKYDTLKLAVSVQDISLFERLLGDEPCQLIADDSIETGTCRIMACEHDVLMDPQAAVTECIQHIRNKLLQRDMLPPKSPEEPKDAVLESPPDETS